MAYAIQNGLESDGIGIKHGSAAVTRKAEAVDINNVDVARAQSETLLQNIRAFIGERSHSARDDLVIGDGAPIDAAFGGGLVGQLVDQRIGNRRAAALFIAIPSGAGLLAVASHFKEPVRDR